MSYLERLIERATDTSLDLENNQIGNYRITPQHGNVSVYHIYKDNAKPNYKTNRRYDNIHVCTITIDFDRVDIEVNSDYLKPNEIDNIINTVNNLYAFGVRAKDVTTKNF